MGVSGQDPDKHGVGMGLITVGSPGTRRRQVWSWHDNVQQQHQPAPHNSKEEY